MNVGMGVLMKFYGTVRYEFTVFYHDYQIGDFR